MKIKQINFKVKITVRNKADCHNIIKRKSHQEDTIILNL